MQLPGRLRLTTLGDLLGALHRACASGILELVEIEGARAGRSHRVFFDSGLIDDVDTAFEQARLGERRSRLEALYGLSEALIRFHVPRPRSGFRQQPLSPREFLHGRPRARADFAARVSERFSSRFAGRSEAARGLEPRHAAYRTLGLSSTAQAREVQRAFRKLAAEQHPDRFPNASPAEKAQHLSRFAQLSAAYHLLMG